MKHKEIAIVTAYIQANNLLNEYFRDSSNNTFFNSVDLAYQIACDFCDEYKNHLPKWDVSKTKIEFDEAIEQFVTNHINN